MKRIVMIETVILLAILAFVPFLRMYSFSMADFTRHAVVEDGNVAEFAGQLTDSRGVVEKWKSVNEQECRNGRFRPLYYLYESIPFWIGLHKAGYCEPGLSGDELRHRINGDRQLHTVYLVGTVALSFVLGGLVVRLVGGSWLYALLFPLAVMFSPTIPYNILVNDTAEVPQVLIFALYLLFFLGGLKSLLFLKNTRILWGALIAGVVAAYVLFQIKETSIVLLGAGFGFIALEWWGHRDYAAEHKRAAWIYQGLHLVVLALLTLWVFTHISHCRGEYSQNYAGRSANVFVDHAKAYWKMLAAHPGTSYIPLAGMLGLIVFGIRFRRRGEAAFPRYWYALVAVVMLFLLGAAFFAVNLPWEWPLNRYLYPTAFFMAAVGCSSVGYLDRVLAERRRVVFRILMAGVLVLVSLPGSIHGRNGAAAKQRQSYGSWVLFPSLLADVRGQMAGVSRGEFHVLMDIPDAAHFMGLQVARALNQEDRENVEYDGSTFLERTYFKEWDCPRTIHIHMREWPDRLDRPYDLIYTSVASRKGPERDRKREMQDAVLGSDYHVTHAIRCPRIYRDPGYELWRFTPEE